MCIRLHAKHPSFLSDFNETNYLDTYSKTLTPNFMKIRTVGALLFYVDGLTDMTLSTAFRNFGDAPKIVSSYNRTKSSGMIITRWFKYDRDKL
jgi:hypothetical protein